MSEPHSPVPQDLPPEFSRPIDVANIGAAETIHEIRATAEERAALVRRFGLLALDRLEARVGLRRAPGNALLYLVGHLAADVTQACVVTLDPVADHIEEDFAITYGRMPEEAEVSVAVDDDTAHEPWPEGPLDIGEAVAQELSLALDPYPHAPGAVLPPNIRPPDAAEPEAVARVNPFSVLAKLQKGEG
jgi:uncharacterized metal-binding protein YceD (DUF177 family)